MWKNNLNSSSSTTAGNHIGTGVGIHEPSWVHYKKPVSKDVRFTFTQYDYADANTKIINANDMAGSIKVKATVWKNGKYSLCTSCGSQSEGHSSGETNGCGPNNNRHNWVNKQDWYISHTKNNSVLYYDKNGTKTQVSYHKI